jgi:hypothetical protein
LDQDKTIIDGNTLYILDQLDLTAD